MLKVLDTIKRANEADIGAAREYECHSCGRDSVMTDSNYRAWRDLGSGERNEAYVCDKCISHGWDEWGQ